MTGVVEGDADRAPGLAALLPELEWRGILHATTPGLPERLASGRRIAAYIGFDPSADSLHVGHLVPIFGLIRLQRSGGRPIALVGGGTGMIGDPSGRSSERNLLDAETIDRNVAAIRRQLERFLDFSPGPAQAAILNNLDWLGKVTLIEYLRDTGKHFTVPYMLAKDSVQQRLERGLSFTEFSYMTLQALDFQTLYREHGVEMQMGGADQWGNITAGLELIRRTSAGDPDESPAHGIAYKLLLSPSGAKFGKSEGGDTVWLDPARTTPYAFYQYWVQTDDRDVGTYLRWFTLFDRREVEALDAAVCVAPGAARGAAAARPGPHGARPRGRGGDGGPPPERGRLRGHRGADPRRPGRDAVEPAARRAPRRRARDGPGHRRRVGGVHVERRGAPRDAGWRVLRQRPASHGSGRAPARPAVRPVLGRPDGQEEPPARRAGRLTPVEAPAPSEASGLVVRVELPAGLEALRSRCVPDAAAGLPAHVTLLYPFADPAAIDQGLRSTVRAIVGRHASWPMRLVEPGRWPGTLYASVEPDAPARSLQADLAAAFPTLPLYGGELPFVPHVTVAEGDVADDPAVAEDPAWRELPVVLDVYGFELIVRRDGRWRTEARFALRPR